MFEFTLRGRMRKCIKILEKCEDNVLMGPDLKALWANQKDRKALKALEAKEYIVIRIGDYDPIAIGLTGNGTLYLLERSEIWKNRIWAFISGITVTILAELLIILIRGAVG